MKRLQTGGFLFFFFLCACSGNDAEKLTPASENDADAARNFINATLKGKLDAARAMLLNDSLNQDFFNTYERFYKTGMDLEDKRGYREASINIHGIRQLNDSISVVNYSNSYKKQQDSLKVIRQNGQWRVDLKYSFPTIANKTLK